MTRSSFKVGESMVIEGILYRIVETHGKDIQLRSLNQGTIRIYTKEELLGFYEKGLLKFSDLLSETQAGDEPLAEYETIQRSLADFPEAIQADAVRKWKYLSKICPDGLIGYSRLVVKQLLAQAYHEIDSDGRHKVPPCVASFYNWRNRWVRSGFDIRSLIDKYELRGRRSKVLPEKVESIIRDGIERIYLTPQRESQKEVIDWVHAQIMLENRTRAPEDALPMVSARTLNRFIGQLDRYAVLRRRYGSRIAEQHVRVFGKGPDCQRPLQRVEVDHSPLDVVAIDERTGLVLGRPWVTAMIDRYSRMPVGLHVSFRKPCVESVLRCLKHAVLPKTYIKERFPAVQGEWDSFGLMETLVCDNGLEFHAKDLEAACADLGVHVVYCPPRSPYFKGSIERFLKTLNYGLLHIQPGTTFARYDKLEGYDSSAMAVLTLRELGEVLHRWIIDIYGRAFHQGIQDAPIHKWRGGISKFPPHLPPDPSLLKVYLGTVETHLLSKNGIRANSLAYNSEALQEIRRYQGDIRLTVRTDPDDIGHVYVLDPIRKAYVEAICTLGDYASGLTVEQHEWIRKKGRENYAGLGYHDQLLSAKAELRQVTESLLQQRQMPSKKAGMRGKGLKDARQILCNEAQSSGSAQQCGAPLHQTSTPLPPMGEALFDFDFPLFQADPRNGLGSQASL